MRTRPFDRNGDDLQQEEVRVMEMLRELFSGPVGTEGLAWFLMQLGWNRRITNDEELARYNFAVELLDAMGITQLPNLDDIVEEFLKLPTYADEAATEEEED